MLVHTKINQLRISSYTLALRCLKREGVNDREAFLELEVSLPQNPLPRHNGVPQILVAVADTYEVPVLPEPFDSQTIEPILIASEFPWHELLQLSNQLSVQRCQNWILWRRPPARQPAPARLELVGGILEKAIDVPSSGESVSFCDESLGSGPALVRDEFSTVL
jgi:hypothetical protein